VKKVGWLSFQRLHCDQEKVATALVGELSLITHGL
jgi:hypothetical protein